MLGEIREMGNLLHNYRRPLGELQQLQDHRLRALVQHAYDRVPYYRELFKSAGLTPKDIQTVRDLPRIPVTTKGALRSLPIENRIASGTNLETCNVRLTSGTTGEPFKVIFSRQDYRMRQLVDFRSLLTIGVRPWDRVAILGPRDMRPKGWHERLGLFRTEVISSAWDLETQIQRLRDYQPTILWAYAHLLDGIVDELDGHLSSVVRPRAVITSAFQLPERAARALRADLGTVLFNFYGAMEVGRIAHECPAHRGLHVNSDRLILECVQDEASTAADGTGSAIVTALDCFTMPFIRYRLGDLVAFAGERCMCGSSFPLIRAPQGREYDLFVLPSGRRIEMMWLTLTLRAIPVIERYRVIQERPDFVVVDLSFWSEPEPGFLDDLKRRIIDGFPEAVQVEVRRFDFRAERGRKFRMVESRVEAGEDWDAQANRS
ncbi:MAG: hypothetical protein M1570_06870 [Chloroflexi bacterium]|nr:hypothetical protein [Chloroflexota bacterium]